nr:SPOR domain-containing protein [uncultured Rhodoferax sp.]
MIEPSLTTRTPPPEEDVTTTLYRAAIGPVSSGYYLPIFTRFEAADHAGISWNTAASLLTLNWLVFRKLWVAALAYVGILVAVALLVFGIARLVFQFSDTLMMALGLGFGLAAFVLPGLFGNALFHTECRKAMAKALTGHANVADARDALLSQASSRNRLFALAGINAVVVLVLALAYQQFTALSNVAVLPHGALEAGNVAVGRTTDTASAARMLPQTPASAPTPAASDIAMLAPANAASGAASAAAFTAASAAGASAVAASAPASASEIPASAPAIAPAASQPLTSAPTPILPAASASSPTTSAPAASAPTAPPPAKAASASKATAKPASTKSSAPASAPTAQARPAKEPEKAKTAKKPSATPAGEPAKKASAAASSQAVASKSFFINVGLFSVPENAAKAHAKLLEAGLPSVMKELKAKTRQIRVRVGPYSTPTQAEAAAEKIKALQLEASIVQL